MSAAEYVAALTPLVSRVRTDVCWSRHKGKPPGRLDQPLTDERLAKHCNGGPAYGVVPMQSGTDTTLVALLDFDSHKGETPWPELAAAAERVMSVLADRGLMAQPFRSSGGHGIHLYLVWDAPQDAFTVRETLREVLTAAEFKEGTAGVAHREIEIFPKQNHVPEGKWGNMFILPLAGESVPLEPLCDLAPLPKASALQLEWAPSAPLTPREKPPREIVAVEPSVELKTFCKALATIPNTGAQELDYDAWRNVIFSIHHATGGSDEGLALAHEFSARAGKADLDFLDNRVWPYIDAGREGGITDRYVLHLASSYGWQEDITGEFEVLAEDSDTASKEDEAKPSKYQFKQAAEFTKGKRGRYLVKGVLPEAALGVIYGASTAGKTFFVLDLVMAVARGVEWRGRRVHQGAVAYICAEGEAGFRDRLTAYGKAGEGDEVSLSEVPFHVLGAAPNFLHVPDVKDLIKAAKTLGPLKIIVVDTFAQVMPGGNENAGNDVGLALSHCRALHAATGALVILIHHSGKDESKGARGWSGLRAAADVEIEVARAEDDRSATVTKLKDGEDGGSFGFKLEVVNLDHDEDGDVITSCVVRSSEVNVAAMKRAARPMTQYETGAWNALNALAGIGGGWVGEDIVLDAAVQDGQVACKEGVEPGSKNDRRRDRYREALRTKLPNRGVVECKNGQVRVAQPPDSEG